jgi:hypothetical protein
MMAEFIASVELKPGCKQMAKHEALSLIELQNLREDVERLLRGEKTLKELVFEVKNMLLPNRYLPSFILE